MQTSKQILWGKTGSLQFLSWGYLGILIFMMGDGIEQGWLSPYLVERGLSIQESAALFTVYGITIGLSSWLSGVLAETYGARKVMFHGLLLYLLGTVGFVGLGIPDLNYPVMLLTYAFRGLGYPLFAYSFLVWIAYNTPKQQLGRAVGWFWFVFTGGLNVLGAYYSSWAIVRLGHINTLWTSVIWALIGAFFALVINRFTKVDRTGAKSKTNVLIKRVQNRTCSDFAEREKRLTKVKDLIKGITIMKNEPKVLIGGIVRIINTTAQFAFPVFLPIYMMEHGFSTTEWLQIWGTIFTSNILFNLIFGYVGDHVGWRNTVIWFGGVGCAIGTLLFYYSPLLFSGSFRIVISAGVFWGAMLAGYVPLSALIPSLVKDDKGAAMSVLNLGAGLAVFVGPALVGLFYGMVGSEGVIWILAGLYLLSAFLTKFITLPDPAKVLITVRD